MILLLDAMFSITESHATLATPVIAATAPAAPLVGIINHESGIPVHFQPIDFRTPYVLRAEMIDEQIDIQATYAIVIAGAKIFQANVILETRTVTPQHGGAQRRAGTIVIFSNLIELPCSPVG